MRARFSGQWRRRLKARGVRVGSRWEHGARPGRSALAPLVAACAAALAACTLTAEELAPTEVVGSVGPEPEVPAGSVMAPALPALPCAIAADCPSGATCILGACAPAACTGEEADEACGVRVCLEEGCGFDACADGVLGAGETDVDCGGPCAPCAVEARCDVASDCASRACVEGRCAPDTCSDGVANGGEGGVDCGGPCAPCSVGATCSGDRDCELGAYCGASGVCAAATCDDGLQNGLELGVDCGGGACPGCASGTPCTGAGDCASAVCGADAVCVTASCDDGVANGDEAGVDCGGACAACESGAGCEVAADCASGVCAALGCAAGVASCCQEPTCDDGVANGGESSVDCGSEACGPCGTGERCSDDGQCATGQCGAAGTCEVPPACDDGVRNGDEAAVDCGGTDPSCRRCDLESACGRDADCASESCVLGRCVSCDDGVQNGDEEGVDCGGARSGCPACIRCTEENSIDLQTVGVLSTIPADACAKITLFPGYAPSLMECYARGPFPVPFSWSQSCSGGSGTHTFTAPYQGLPVAPLTTDCPVILDFRGSAAPLELRWY